MTVQGNEKQEFEEVLGERELFRRVNALIDRVSSDLGKDGEEELSNLAGRLPSMLLNSGALMTVAYLLKRCMSKDKSKAKAAFMLIDSMMEWLERRDLIKLEEGKEGKGGERSSDSKEGGIECERLSRNIFNEFLRKNMREFSWISDELLRYSEVLKVLAQARIGEAEERVEGQER